MDAQRLLREVEERTDVVFEAMRFVTDHPEVGHQERECAQYLTEQLARLGFRILEGVAGLRTAFTATMEARGGGRRVGVVALYDAVPAVDAAGERRPNHSCGHACLSGAVMGTAAVWSALREELSGAFVVIGCPADEHALVDPALRGGKEVIAEAGVLDGLDNALYVHPEDQNAVWRASEWMIRLDGTVLATRPAGMAALLEHGSEVVRLAPTLGPGRVMVESVETAGDVFLGASIVLRAYVVIRGPSAEVVRSTARQVREKFRGLRWRARGGIHGIRPDPELVAVAERCLEAAGLPFDPNPPSIPYATDFGNISRQVPSAMIGVGHRHWKFHSAAGARQFAGPDGERVAMDMARVLTLTVASIAQVADSAVSREVAR
jgi:metal-dependent amidase/aminoacylase/carboxypeptidase family protein